MNNVIVVGWLATQLETLEKDKARWNIQQKLEPGEMEWSQLTTMV